MTVVCINNKIIGGLTLTLGKSYTIIHEYELYALGITQESWSVKKYVYWIKNDYGNIMSISTKYFVSLEEYRISQIDKILL